MCPKPTHAKFQRFSAKETFSNCGLNRDSEKYTFFNGKLVMQISDTMRNRAKIIINHYALSNQKEITDIG